MKRALLLAVLTGIVAACASDDAMTTREMDRVGTSQDTRPDTCNMAAHRHLVGQSPADIDMGTLPANTRTICYGCLATQDFVPRRLNLQLGRDGKVASLRCG
ncbi:hypothetical protein [Terricaulis sp.]|uniref:hypothetical protein n=1 Tax=Terricaulis sp. TaxID=2768686 RepID=UPI00378457F8